VLRKVILPSLILIRLADLSLIHASAVPPSVWIVKCSLLTYFCSYKYLANILRPLRSFGLAAVGVEDPHSQVLAISEGSVQNPSAPNAEVPVANSSGRHRTSDSPSQIFGSITR